MTMTRQQLEDVIDRQLALQRVRPPRQAGERFEVDASTRAILAAVDDWAAGQVAAAVTPPATIHSPKVMARIRERMARALDTTTGGS